MDDDEVRRQIVRMKNFIDSEGDDKVTEIHRKVEEEFFMEKEKLTKEGMDNVDKEYKKKYVQADLEMRMEIAGLKNQGRMHVMQAKEDNVEGILEEVLTRLVIDVQDSTLYSELLEKLILQGLLTMLESEVSLSCRPNDICLINTLLPGIERDYASATSSTVKVLMDSRELDPSSAGGVILTTSNDDIRVDNTLEARTKLVAWHARPMIQELLYGRNPNRKYDD